ncbi:MAG: hypothetical protein R3264_18220, partial [Anaerolineae bacterium]|nr:hypothetical protein [Anaerolineae bacterium]
MKHLVGSTRFWFRGGLVILLTAVPLYALSTVWNVAATFEEFGAAKPVKPAELGLPQVSQTIQVSDHPRLLFAAGSVAALKSKRLTTHNEIWLPIKAFAEVQLASPPPLIAPLEGDEDAYRNFGNQLIPVAFACLVTDAENYCELARSYLLAYAAWEQWGNNNWRDLGHSHMLLANALAYDWLYQKLTPAERQTVRLSLGNWAHKMYEASLGP